MTHNIVKLVSLKECIDVFINQSINILPHRNRIEDSRTINSTDTEKSFNSFEDLQL